LNIFIFLVVVNIPTTKVEFIDMAKLFELTNVPNTFKKYDATKKAYVTTELPDVVPASLKFTTKPTASFDEELISEITGLKTVEIKNAVANLARTDYEAYLGYKQSTFEKIKTQIIGEYAAAAKRWKELGYTDADALEAAKKSVQPLKHSLMEWYDELFSAPKGGVEVKYVY
jgi:hypothetical protein